jgi:hypothetical protein
MTKKAWPRKVVRRFRLAGSRRVGGGGPSTGPGGGFQRAGPGLTGQITTDACPRSAPPANRAGRHRRSASSGAPTRLISKERLDSGWSHAPESASVHVPIDIFLVIKAVAVIAVRVWSRRPGWCDRQILALTAGAPFACAWHAVTSTLAFDSAPLIVARGSPRWASAALALAAVWRGVGDAHDSAS